MSSESHPASDREQHLESVLLSYLEAVEAGTPPDPGELLARHPDLAPELGAFLADEERLAPVVALVQEIARAKGEPDTPPVAAGGSATPFCGAGGSATPFVGAGGSATPCKEPHGPEPDKVQDTDSEEQHPTDGSDVIDPERARQREAVYKRFETAWKSGRPPAIETFLEGWSGPERRGVLRELVLLDVHYRRRFGEPAGDYGRLAEFDPCWLAEVSAVGTPTPEGRVPTGEFRAAGNDLSSAAGQADAPAPPGYEVLGVLGKGGMGIVYKARQIRLDRLVALKVIRQQRSPNGSAEKRFQAEAQIVALFQHPNIVGVYDSVEHEGRSYLILEYVRGGSLKDRPRGKTWAPVAAARLVACLADAVEYAHRNGVIHRDLKPANILLTDDGVPKITDFGLSKQLQGEAAQLTDVNDRLGTPAYMAPEQADGRTEAIGPGTDVFGLGAILYDLLTARPPFDGATMGEVMGKAREGQVRPPRSLNPQVPFTLERICLRATAADPQQRHSSAAALAEDLRGFLRRSRLRTGLLAAACVLLVAAAVCVGFLSLQRGTPAPGTPLPPAQPPDQVILSPQPGPPAPVPSPLPLTPTELALKAREILKTNCYRCHGQDGNVEGGLNYVLDRQQLVLRRKMVAPGNPAASRLLQRVRAGEMPPADEQPRPSTEDIDLLEQWIANGAPNFDTTPRGDFISPAAVLQFIRADLEKTKAIDRKFQRYFTITHLHNAGLPEDGLETYRFALSKLVNSLSWRRTVTRPVAVDPARTIFRIDLRDFEWNEKVWELILAVYPYGIDDRSDAARFCVEATHCPLPHVRADWFVFEASRPPLYHQVLQLPDSARGLETLLRVDVAENVRKLRVDRAGFNGSGVSVNNRLIERHADGAYWKSYDFADLGNAPQRNLFLHPLGPAPAPNAFQHGGSEIIFHLPNGLQGYMLADAAGKRIPRGPTDIVRDPRQRDGAVVNGISCMSCHVRGMIEKDDEIRPHVLENRQDFDNDETETILALYPTRAQFRDLLRKDADRFAAAVKETGALLNTTDPIVALASRYEWELDLKAAAAEAGVRSEDLTEELTHSHRLARVFGPLKIESGTVQRQVFVDNFGDLVLALRLGDYRPPRPPSNDVTDKDILVNSTDMKLKRLPAGTFWMGSPANEHGRAEDEARHQVDIRKPFSFGLYPVTQDEYEKVMRVNPSYFSAGGDGKVQVRAEKTGRFPVESVSFVDAQEFCRRLSALPEEKKAGRKYRLPTEAEREYACRAGTDTAYSFGDDPRELDLYAWYAGNSENRPHPVGEKRANPWGLYDMHGNVSEYCDSLYNPTGAGLQVRRGGSFDSSAEELRSADRRSTLKGGNKERSYGFRVVLEVEDTEPRKP